MKNKETYTEDQILIARYARALGHPVRIYILSFLSKEACCYNKDFSEILPIAKSTLSQHFKELLDAGLIQGEIMPPRIKYCINEKNWDKAKELFHNFFNFDL